MSTFRIEDSGSREPYIQEVHKEYENLLVSSGDDESKFQIFFEKNPALVPGSNCIFGESGSSPLLYTLISQPQIGGLITRIPDFMWLASDSMTFNPVLIEIEAPNKPLFNKDGTQTAVFTKARNQLNDWQSILQDPVNQMKFYNDFSIPPELRRLKFKPSYLLIYGRRAEYASNLILSAKRGNIMGSDEMLMSFDRLEVNPRALNCYTPTVRNGNYYAKYVSPAILVSDAFYDIYNKVENFDQAIEDSAYLSTNRKDFIKERIKDFLKAGPKPRLLALPVSRFGDFVFE